MQLPDEQENALVVYSDTLPDRYHDSFMEAIESNEGQSANNLYEVLARKVFWHGGPMLDTLHKEGHLKKIPTSSITMTPNSNTNIELDKLIVEIEKQKSDNPVEEVQEENTKSRVDSNVEESKQDENRQIAQNLLVQAELLENDAQAKREEAYKYDASLKPKVRVTTKSEKASAKKRGRPKKAEA